MIVGIELIFLILLLMTSSTTTNICLFDIADNSRITDESELDCEK